METIAIPHRIETIRAHQAKGGRVAAVLPIHYPRALFRAFDILPVEVWGPPRVDSTLGAAHLQSYVCSIVRNALSYLLAGNLDLADLIVVPHTCDSLQGFASILIDFIKPASHVIASEAKQSPTARDVNAASSPNASRLLAMTKPVLPIYLPRDRRASDLEFLTAEFHSIYAKLEKITDHHPTDSELLACIEREERADDLLADLHRNRLNLPLTQIELYRLIRSREYLPAETFTEIVGATLVVALRVVAQEGRPQGSPQRVPIILSGIVPEPMSIFETLEQMNAVIVADDFAACGRRLYSRGTNVDPLTRMAERILSAPPDSTRGSSIQDRIEYLIALVKSSGARGIVFYDVKFCEPELFYHPKLRQALQAQGIPSVVIEFDLNDPLSQQIQTRLEAFVEMIA